MSPASEMVWCGARKGRCAQQPLARLEQPHDAVNLGGLQGLFLVQGRQDGRQPLGQHGLAGPRRADHQDVVAAGRGQQQGPFDRLLALDLPEIQVVVRRQVAGFFRRSHIRPQGLAAGQEFHQLGEMIGGKNFEALDHRGLPGVVPGDDQGQAGLAGGQGHGEDAPGGLQAAVQGQFPKDEVLLQALLGHDPLGRQDAHGHRQIKAGALLADVGRRQIDGDAVAGEFIAGVLQGGPDPVLALLHRNLGQAHGGEVRQARGQVHLHLHQVGIHSPQGAAVHSGQHAGFSPAAGAKSSIKRRDDAVQNDHNH